MNERNNFNDFVINDGEQIFLKIKIVKIGILFLIYLKFKWDANTTSRFDHLLLFFFPINIISKNYKNMKFTQI